MRGKTGFSLAKIALALAAMLTVAAAPPRSGEAVAIPGGHVYVRQHGARTVISVFVAGSRRRLSLPTETSIYAAARPLTSLVGALPGRVLILQSDYSSNPSGGSYQCGAGTETVLRVLALQPALHQTFSQRIASCWDNIDSGDVAWDARTQTLTVERTTVEGAKPESEPKVEDLRTQYRVEPDGAVIAGQIVHVNP